MKNYQYLLSDAQKKMLLEFSNQHSCGMIKKHWIAYSDIKGHISSLRADNNRLSTQITKSKKDLEELRSFVENCVAYKRYKIYSINEEKASDKEKYYEAHDSQLDAFYDAVFALERRNIDLDSITYKGIKIMQQKVTEAETEIKRQEDIKRQNERDLKELSDYQKEIDLYFGRMNDEIQFFKEVAHNPDHPANLDVLIQNFDCALSHPDANDLEKLKEAVMDSSF